ncbi:MAG: glycoside hydrolase [Bacteroides xylanisolvens]|nr:MAG: glycoside hydrolase [Bacteroides xylanisolvens]
MINSLRFTIILIVLLTICPNLISQIRLNGYNQDLISPHLFKGKWNAYWISPTVEPSNEYGVYHFRKTFDFDSKVEKFIIHVSADNRYKLFVNEHLVSLGPALGNIYNWNFETVDIAPYLTKGKNVIAALVWNFADKKPLAHISFNQTGFILQGNSSIEEIVNTNSSWKCIGDKAYSPWESSVKGYYAAGACESIDTEKFLWGWDKIDYDDSDWSVAISMIQGATKGAKDYPGRQLVPRPIPPMEMSYQRISMLRKSQGMKCPDRFPFNKEKILIPPNSEVELLLDSKHVTTGYLTLNFSQGEKADIRIGYAEALYLDKEKVVKGNRNEIEGKEFVGYEDRIIPDGGSNRSITTLWWRTWRYIRLKIKTNSKPLIIDDIFATISMYPFVKESIFTAPGNEYLNDILTIGWRTARLCANETYMDCPYYEQLQYFGDARIQAMITMYNTRDTYIVKNVLEQGRQSISADGITMSRYPSSLHQFIPSFSLWWICMGYDYWMYRGDEAYLKTLLPAYRGVLSWYEQYLKADYSLGYIPYWFFADWSGTPFGEPIRESEGNSAFQDLLFVMALEFAAKMEDKLGSKVNGQYYVDMARRIKETFHKKYWDEHRKLFADTYKHQSFSQHTNVLAILAGVCTKKEMGSLIDRVLEDKSLNQCTIFFRYYLQQAMNKAGRGDRLLSDMQIYKDQMDMGLTTWAEQPEPSRSDCHAWGSSANIEFYRTILGIDSDAPGFEKVLIKPSLGALKEVSGSIPHPNGVIKVKYRITEQRVLIAEISIPSNVSGIFIWKGKEYKLQSGNSILRIV